MWDYGVMEGGIFHVFWKTVTTLLPPLRLLQTALHVSPQSCCVIRSPMAQTSINQGWQGWKRIDGKGWAGWWQHLEDVTQWEGGEFGKQDKHRRVANGKTKVLLSGTEKNNAKTGLENKQGNKTLINKPRKKTTVCIVYNNLKMERWLTSCLQPL